MSKNYLLISVCDDTDEVISFQRFYSEEDAVSIALKYRQPKCTEIVAKVVDSYVLTTEEIKNKFFDRSELSVRTINTLWNENIRTTNDLLSLSKTDLLKMRGIGRKAVNEIINHLDNFDLRLNK